MDTSDYIWEMALGGVVVDTEGCSELFYFILINHAQ